MITLFSTLMFKAENTYHDSALISLGVPSGLVQSKSAYEAFFYPALKPLNYQEFVRE